MSVTLGYPKQSHSSELQSPSPFLRQDFSQFTTCESYRSTGQGAKNVHARRVADDVIVMGTHRQIGASMVARGAKATALLIVAILAGLLGATSAHADELAEVQGVVTVPGGGVPDTPVSVILSTTSWDNPVTTHFTTTDPVTGHYNFAVPAGSYYLRFEYTGSANIVPIIWSNGGFSSPASPLVALASGATLVLNRELIPGAVVTGTAFGTGGTTLSSLQVVGSGGFFSHGRSTFDATTGVYVLDRLPPGTYSIDFTPNARWKTGRINLSPSTLAVGEVRAGQDIVLADNTTIEGQLFYRGGPPGVYPQGTHVRLWNPSNSNLTNETTAGADGSFHMYGVAPGTYQVCTADWARNFVPNCWGDSPWPGGTTVTVIDGQVVSGIDIGSDPVGSIEGRLLARLSQSAAGSPLETGRVTAYRLEGGSYVAVASTTTQLDGTFVLIQLPPGNYRVRFADDDRRFNAEYWDDQRYFGSSTDISVVAGSTLTLADAILDAKDFDVSRISGADRFDVGVSVSRELYPVGSVPSGGVPVVYVANGYNFPDALAAGPAAALQGGSVLLVEPWAIPASVAGELTRLAPQRIVVAGGPASVSPAVFEQLKAFVPSPLDVVRANGVDRYEASRSVVWDAFGDVGADIAIVTTGANFPDALSAGPAAASQSGPVILVDGSASSIDADTRDLIVDLDIQHVYIAGGTGSVSPGIEASLRALLGASEVTRFAGTDRFEVGVLLSQEFFSDTDYSFIATGYKFPDALTGGPLAAAFGSPLYLSQPECLPANVAYDILDLNAQAVVLLGGPGSLSPAVENLQLC